MKYGRDVQKIKLILDGNIETNKKLDVLVDCMHDFQRDWVRRQGDFTKHNDVINDSMRYHKEHHNRYVYRTNNDYIMMKVQMMKTVVKN